MDDAMAAALEIAAGTVKHRRRVKHNEGTGAAQMRQNHQ